MLAVATQPGKYGTGRPECRAGTRKIEYGAEAVVDLSRPEDTKPDAKEVPSLPSCKNRHGAVGVVSCAGMAPCNASRRFRPVAPDRPTLTLQELGRSTPGPRPGQGTPVLLPYVAPASG